MCAPFSPTDTSEPTVTAFDLTDAAEHTRLMVDAVTEVVRMVAIDDATSAQLGARGAQHANLLRMRFEEGVIALRAVFCNALAGTATTYASETDLAEALKARIERNNRAILSTAMRRVETAEAADAALTADAHDRGDAISAALYGTTETAPCADLTREAERFDYGRSAAANASASHGAYERGFVSPAAA
ncbi:hypothetical protein [Methylorubrum salsuginis]|uniref:Uncharacterized protein n=1 Tax=Methylorubrum salsuginis TaxID=414703 RepID=A0A1I4FMF9_9HYPH|nr:hypothetical protein [Methylorubrum salsuginis]SFL17741.1 hypothetical protein SAMN04488125_11061 [Methylorubrum salsuginis]